MAYLDHLTEPVQEARCERIATARQLFDQLASAALPTESGVAAIRRMAHEL